MKNLILIAAFLLTVSSSLASTCESGFEAFKQTVYPKVSKSCTLCHDGSRPNAPAFVTKDVAANYEFLASYMNFGQISDSLLVIRAGNGHCLVSNCNADSGAEMMDLAQKWYSNGENSCYRNGRFFSSSIEIPNTLPKVDQGFATLSLPLDAIDQTFKGIKFEVDAQSFIEASDATRGAYRFKSPRLVDGTGAVYVQNIKILLNGKYDVIYNAYTGIDRNVSFVPMNIGGRKSATAVLSGSSLIILKDSLPSAKLSVSFDKINFINESQVNCINLNGFANGVAPMLKTLACNKCHNSTGTLLGTRIFDLSLEQNNLCRIATALMEPKLFMSSPLVTFPTRGYFNHPQLPVANHAEYTSALKKWITNN